MPEYRVKFPDGQVWKIQIGKESGDAARHAAHVRASAARAAGGDIEPVAFEECEVDKMTAALRAKLKGLPFLDANALLVTARSIGAEYQADNLALTLRGMYYQFVSRGFLPSGQAEYNRVKKALADARLRGTFPLDMLSDSSRQLHPGASTRYDLDVSTAIDQAGAWIPQLDRFFIAADRWYRQPVFPIVLFEKEALGNVFGPLCRELGVPFMATKGYPSVSTLYELHQLMKRAMDPKILSLGLWDLGYAYLEDLDPKKAGDLEDLLDGHQEATEVLVEHVECQSSLWTETQKEDGEKAHIHKEGARYRYRYGDLAATQWHQGTASHIVLLYFGDHDPDGMEIPDDLVRRLRIIQVRDDQVIPFETKRLGLNQDQIEHYGPPPFWAKESSSRYHNYVERHPWVNDRAWELDALEPRVLRDIVRESIEDLFDEEIYEEVQGAVSRMRERFNTKMRDDVLPRMLANAEEEVRTDTDDDDDNE